MKHLTAADLDDLCSPVQVHVLGDSISLSPLEKSVLELGSKFIPAPKPGSPQEVSSMLQVEFNRFSTFLSLRLKHPNFEKPRWQFRGRGLAQQTEVRQPFLPEHPEFPFIHALKRLVTSQAGQSGIAALSCLEEQQQRNIQAGIKALRKRCLDGEIVIRETDKNLGTAVMDLGFYRSHVLALLDSSKYRLDTTAIPLLRAQLTRRYKDLVSLTPADLRIPGLKELNRHLLQQSDATVWRFQAFYGIPKVHKNPIAFRPIQTFTGWLAQPLAAYLATVLQPYLCQYFPETILKDSATLVKELENYPYFPPGSKLASFDVVNLYPSIPVDELKDILRRRVGLIRRCYQESLGAQLPASYTEAKLLELFSFILDCNYCVFDQKLYQQISGIPTGANCSVELANLYLAELEKPLVDSLPFLFYRRYIDDGLVILPKGFELENAVRAFNSLSPAIKVTFSEPARSLPFLDVLLDLNPALGSLSFSVYQKELNRYLYIPGFSFHSPALFTGFIRAELLRYVLRSSSEPVFAKVRGLLLARLFRRGYPLAKLLPAFASVSYKEERARLLQPSREVVTSKSSTPTNNPVPFILPYNTDFAAVNIKRAFAEALEFSKDDLDDHSQPRLALVWNAVLMAWKASPSLGAYLKAPILGGKL